LSKTNARGRDAFTAIADPTRREIVDLLHDRGALMAGEIASFFGSASRPGISRHLRVLRECGVVNCRRDGKAQLYTLNPHPLEKIRDVWLGRFGTMQVESLAALREAAQAKQRR
jgi:DNA-binding transcriptional ArsR family regulator